MTNHSVHSIGVSLRPSTKALNILIVQSDDYSLAWLHRSNQWQKNSLGYLPNDLRWPGFRVCEKRAIIITSSGREFSPKEFESFVFWLDEHRQLVEKFGHIDQPKVYPAKENVLPFKGGRRMKAAEWIPTKYKRS